MTLTDKKAFTYAFNRLAAAGIIRDIDTATMGIYFDTLFDLPLWAVERAEIELRRHPVRFFQGSATWYATAEQILREQRRKDTIALATKRLLPEHCPQCRDSGMRLVDGADPDSRLTHCECRETNPNYLQMRARLRMGDDGEGTPTIPDTDSKRITDTVRDFRRLSSGDDQ